MVEHECKSSEDKQSQKMESVSYGTYEKDLYEELLANTTGKCQKIPEACKLANPKDPQCTCLRYVKSTKLGLKHFQHWQGQYLNASWVSPEAQVSMFFKVLQAYKAALKTGTVGGNSQYRLSTFVQKEDFLI